MGIKFRCPNGHKLHVKSFLAGKKGVCPKCGIKVDVPAATNSDDPDDAPTPPGGIQLGPAPAASLFPTPAQPLASPDTYAAPPAIYTPPPEPFGLPSAALPQPAAPYAAGGRTYARPIPIPMPTPALFPVPSAPVAGSPQPVPGAAPLGDPYAGMLLNTGRTEWNPNAPLAVPAAGPLVHEPHLPVKRGGLNLGKNGTILLVFVAVVLVVALVWSILKSTAKPKPPDPANTESSRLAPLDSSSVTVL